MTDVRCSQEMFLTLTDTKLIKRNLLDKNNHFFDGSCENTTEEKNVPSPQKPQSLKQIRSFLYHKVEAVFPGDVDSSMAYKRLYINT